jgi:hypothetical protein
VLPLNRPVVAAQKVNSRNPERGAQTAPGPWYKVWQREERMNKIVTTILVVVALGPSVTAAPAMPFPGKADFSGPVVFVADGCGFNRYRDSRGICRRKYVVGRYGKKPLYGACGGVNSHRVCNLYGQCWMVCD